MKCYIFVKFMKISSHEKKEPLWYSFYDSIIDQTIMVIIYICIFGGGHAYMHTYMHTYVHTYTHTSTYKQYLNTYTHLICAYINIVMCYYPAES